MKITVSERPDLMEKWDFDENKNIGLFSDKTTIGSGKKAWWRCKDKQHLYQRSIDKEVSRKSECPICKKESQEYLTDYPDVMEKWDFDKNKNIGLFPDKITISSGKKAWWRCKDKQHLYQERIDVEVSRKSKCPICKRGSQKYLTDYPEILKEFAYDLNDVKPEELTRGSGVSVKWRCEKYGHVWKTSPYHRIIEKSKCPYCANKKSKLFKEANDLLTINPPNMKYWDFDKNEKEDIFPRNYVISSKKKAWWICDKGHSTFESINTIMWRKVEVCSECKKEKNELLLRKEKEKEIRKATLKNKKEIAIQAKKELRIKESQKYFDMIQPIKKYWDYEENKKRGFDIESISHQRLYCWKCDKGHKWKDDLEGIKDNSICPVCYVEENSIAKKYPYLINIYNTEKNSGVPPEKCIAVSAKYYWWTCKNGHTFIATLNSVIKHKETGCMFCNKEKSYYSL